MDPIGEKGGVNLTLAFDNSPLNNYDVWQGYCSK